jgi:hypothetical protein
MQGMNLNFHDRSQGLTAGVDGLRFWSPFYASSGGNATVNSNKSNIENASV